MNEPKNKFDQMIDAACRILSKPIHRISDREIKFLGDAANALDSVEKKDELQLTWGGK